MVLSAIEENEPVLGWKITGPRPARLAFRADWRGHEGGHHPRKRCARRGRLRAAGRARRYSPHPHRGLLKSVTSKPIQKNTFTDVSIAECACSGRRPAGRRPHRGTCSGQGRHHRGDDTRQGQKLALASSVGQLALALRAAGSTKGEASPAHCPGRSQLSDQRTGRFRLQQ